MMSPFSCIYTHKPHTQPDIDKHFNTAENSHLHQFLHACRDFKMVARMQKIAVHLVVLAILATSLRCHELIHLRHSCFAGDVCETSEMIVHVWEVREL